MQPVLIDRNGKTWDAMSMELRELYAAWCSQETFENFLIRNNSFVRFLVGERSVDVSLAPALLTTQAYAKLAEMLAAYESSRIKLRWFDGYCYWQDRICPSARNCRKAILELATTCKPANVDKYLARPLDPRDLDPNHPLLALLDVWKMNAGRLSINNYPRVIDDNLQRRFVTARREAETSRLLFSRIGEGYKMYHSSWAHQLIGQRVEDQPDVRYARWVGDRWREAILAGQPMLCEADVIVEDPISEARRRVQYLRLTLPIFDASGEQELLSASVGDPNINLRVEVDHKSKDIID